MKGNLFKKMARAKDMDGRMSRLEFKQASEWDDVLGSFRLLYKSYLQRNLLKPNKSELRYTFYNLLPTTATFVAKYDDNVVATLSTIVEDGTSGLPMDELYFYELNEYRREGHLAEGTGLAVDPRYRSIGLYIVMNLVKMGITYMRKLNAAYAVIACHPKHAGIYEKIYLFRQFGDIKVYHAVNNAPAVALALSLTNLEETYRQATSTEGYGIYRYFFTDELFRCPHIPLRAGAFSQAINQRLCTLQPSVMNVLERKAPGIVRRLTGWDLPSTDSFARQGFRYTAEEHTPVFIPA